VLRRKNLLHHESSILNAILFLLLREDGRTERKRQTDSQEYFLHSPSNSRSIEPDFRILDVELKKEGV
jgi:hypothetical protein